MQRPAPQPKRDWRGEVSRCLANSTGATSGCTNPAITCTLGPPSTVAYSSAWSIPRDGDPHGQSLTENRRLANFYRGQGFTLMMRGAPLNFALAGRILGRAGTTVRADVDAAGRRGAGGCGLAGLAEVVGAARAGDRGGGAIAGRV